MGRSQAQFTEQGQDTEAGHRDRSEAGHNSLGPGHNSLGQVIHRQVTGTVTEVTGTGYSGRSQG